MSEVIQPNAETIVEGLSNLLMKEKESTEERRTWNESYIGSNIREKLHQALTQVYRPARSFRHLRRMAVGLTDSELKKILLELDATCFFKANGTEMWYLKNRASEKSKYYSKNEILEVSETNN